jgi:hypothetical protein
VLDHGLDAVIIACSISGYCPHWNNYASKILYKNKSILKKIKGIFEFFRQILKPGGKIFNINKAELPL